mgnify:CR=1 FL=1
MIMMALLWLWILMMFMTMQTSSPGQNKEPEPPPKIERLAVLRRDFVDPSAPQTILVSASLATHLRLVDGNCLDMPAEHLALERACLAALLPLTPYEREIATAQAEEHLGAIAREAFYQRYPERRP